MTQEQQPTTKKQSEMEAEIGMQIQPLEPSLVDPIVTDNEMLGGDDTRTAACQVLERSVEKRSGTRTMSLTAPTSENPPVPVGMAIPDSVEQKEETITQVLPAPDEAINTNPHDRVNETGQSQAT